LGFKVYRNVNFRPGYERIFPEFTYAPWSVDKKFLDVYKKIKNNTMVDKYRCYELWQLVSQCVKLNGALIEVGAWRGGTGAIICNGAKLSGLKRKVYIADTFRGLVKISKKDSFYKGGECSDTSREIVENLLEKKLKLKNFQILEGIFSDETGHLVKERKFSFCHIDVDIYKSAKDIVKWIWPKLCVGDIIVYDDMGARSTMVSRNS
jgi:O-methyltransferase